MFWQALITGIVTGSSYALIAMGLVVIFKATETPNFGGGETFMAGAYLGLVLFVFLGVSYFLTYLLSVTIVFVAGFIFQKIVLLPITRKKGAVVSMVIGTLGLSFFLKGFVRLFKVGETFRSFPPIFGTKPIIVHDIVLTPQGLAILVSSVLIMIIFFLFFHFTKIGLAMRAVSMNAKAASLVGINIKRIYPMIWGIGFALTAAAGVMVAPVIMIHPDMGSIALRAFAAGVIGGFTSLPGAVVGGILIGIVENMAGVYIASQMIVVTPFLLIMITLLVRPGGLFTSVVQKKV
ncbi:MAG: branched-chain amino acid ABC transporter permease [Thermodesulfobacteriota bacterium]